MSFTKSTADDPLLHRLKTIANTVFANGTPAGIHDALIENKENLYKMSLRNYKTTFENSSWREAVLREKPGGTLSVSLYGSLINDSDRARFEEKLRANPSINSRNPNKAPYEINIPLHNDEALKHLESTLKETMCPTIH